MKPRFYFRAGDILHDAQCLLDIALTFSVQHRAMIAKCMIFGVGLDFWGSLPTNPDRAPGGCTLALRLPGAGVVIGVVS